MKTTGSRLLAIPPLRRLLALVAMLAAALALYACLMGPSAHAGPTAAPGAHATSTARQASSSLQVGISDNDPATFADPRFRWLRMRVARLTVPWNIVRRRTELGWKGAWLEAAHAHGVRPLVVFDKDPVHPGHLPSLIEYDHMVSDFMKLFPWVHDYSPWNEENHYLQPTANNPQRAAQYFNLLSLLCHACSVTAADVLDIPNMAEWVGKFLHYAHHPRMWGLHNYADLSKGESYRTSLFLSMVPGQVWFTETGGVVWRYEHANHTYVIHSESFASEVAGHLLGLAHISSRVTRIYYYQWRVPYSLDWAKRYGKLTWDSGLIRPDCSTRPAFSVIARAIGKNPAHQPRARRNRAGACV